jgi:hypothetical protein
VKIKEIHIKAFGRFTDKSFKLGGNFNIIYALNEKGKSTLHRFIEAMFFGFAKPGVKRRVMTEEYDLCRPWTGELYGGSLVYEAGGRLYKVERSFERGRESVRVFDHITGEEVTGEFAYDKARREVLFAREHLGLGQAAYRNTISISQLGSRSDRSLAREIQTRFGNLSRAGDASLSVERAEKLICEYVESIGTDRAYTKEYGRLCRRAKELEEGLEEAAAAVDSIRQSGRQLKDMEREAARLELEREGLERRIKALEDSALLDRWAEIKRLAGECESLADQLECFGDFSGFDKTGSGELFMLDQLAEQDRREVQKARNRIEEVSLEIEDVKADIARTGGEGEGPGRARPKGGLGLCAISVIAAIGIFLLAAVLERPSLYALLVPALGLIVYSVSRMARQSKALKDREGAARALVTELQYMERYRQDLMDSLSAKEKELAEREERISAILVAAGVGSIGEYREKAAGHERYTRLKAGLEQAGRLLEVRLDGDTYAALEERVKNIMKGGEAATTSGEATAGPLAAMAFAGDRKQRLADLKRQLEDIRQEEMALLGSIEKVRGGMEALEQTIADLPGMEEELSGARNRLRKLSLEREAAEIALEALRETSAGIHREFAPALNRKVAEITSRITGGRYSDLSITKDIEILATAPETGRRVEAEALSAGTLDQLYFALRVAASEFLSDGRKLPLILDDCFVQYDARRLENVMKFILEEARERQIILFTCHEREKGVAETLGEVYNYLIID